MGGKMDKQNVWSMLTVEYDPRPAPGPSASPRRPQSHCQPALPLQHPGPAFPTPSEAAPVRGRPAQPPDKVLPGARKLHPAAPECF